MTRARGHTAVMANRTEPPDSLDFFPTPPWATRAVMPILQSMDPFFSSAILADPACGEGHMAAVLAEFSLTVLAFDVFPHNWGRLSDLSQVRPPQLHDFLGESRWPDAAELPSWIVMNPPFKTAEEFARRALFLAQTGVAMLVRSAWLEGVGRYDGLFKVWPPRLIAQFAERVPMTKGRWDPEASTATAYCWVIWTRREAARPTEFRWIPPGKRKALTRPQDAATWGVERAAPLFGGLAK